MIAGLGIILTTFAALTLLLAMVLAVEIFAAVWLARPLTPASGRRPRVAVLVPAHDEAQVIAQTLSEILPQLQTGDRLVVVADNCSDETAAIARAHGVEVVERRDPARRGKGYALDFGLTYLAGAAPEVVVIVDADCKLHPNALERVAARCLQTGRPIQAQYLMHAGRGAQPKLRVAEFAWLVKNLVRPLGLRQLGWPCQLMGTGIALPWGLTSKVSLATGNLVEDLKLGADLARAGFPPLFCPEALVTSDFPAIQQGIDTQRRRWEHGHLSMIIKDGMPMIAHAVLTGSLPVLVLALDMIVPPTALVCLATATLWSLSAITMLVVKLPAPLLLTTCAMALLATSLMTAWLSFGRTIVSGKDLAAVVAYGLAKLPVYVSFLFARQMNWVRSSRQPGE